MERQELKELAELVLINSWEQLKISFPELSQPMPEILIKSNMASKRDYALASFERNKIVLSHKEFVLNFDLYMSDIILHEVAHFAAYHIYNCINHGKGWKKCCEMLKIKKKILYMPSYSM